MSGSRHPHRSHPAHRGERGSILVLVLFFAVFLGGVALVSVEEGMADRTSLTHFETSMRALEIAESGLLRAEMEVLANEDPDGDGLGNMTGTFAGGTYRVRAVQHPLNARRWQLRATGVHGLSARHIEVGVLVLTGARWQHALFSREYLELKVNTATDSYDSRLGPYAAQATNFDPFGAYAAMGGHVGSNAGIQIKLNTVIRGDARPGPLATTDVAPGSVVTGDTTPMPEEHEVPPLPYEMFVQAMNNNDNASIDRSGSNIAYNAGQFRLTASGTRVVELPGGTFFFTSISLEDDAVIRVTAPSRIFVTDFIEIAGGGIENPSEQPFECQILGHPYNLPESYALAGSRRATIELKGSPRVYAAVYAPGMDVEFKAATDFYGSVVGGRIELKAGSLFHYDQALEEIRGVGSGRTKRLYWVDRAPPAR